jgi:hypothetical protein
VIGKVPLLGTCQEMTAEAGPRTAAISEGAPAALTVALGAGVTGSEGDEARELPTEFAAVTLKVYAESSVRPETVQ